MDGQEVGLGANQAIDEAQLRHSLRIAAHDLRSMLGPLAGYAELLAVTDDPARFASYLAKIAESVERIEDLADNLVERILSEVSVDSGSADKPGAP